MPGHDEKARALFKTRPPRSVWKCREQAKASTAKMMKAGNWKLRASARGGIRSSARMALAQQLADHHCHGGLEVVGGDESLHR